MHSDLSKVTNCIISVRNKLIFTLHIMMHFLQYQSKFLMLAGFNKLYPYLQGSKIYCKM